jgi:hypothetical protein
MQLMSEQEKVEYDNVEICVSVVPVEPSIARKVLRKYRGDIQKAVDALLAGDRGADVWESKHRTTPEPAYGDAMDTTAAVIPTDVTLPSSSSVIDLTTDEDDMSRAIQMSIQESSQTGTQFGPSDRAPHPEWQMVRSNVMCFTQTTSSKVPYKTCHRTQLRLLLKITP